MASLSPEAKEDADLIRVVHAVVKMDLIWIMETGSEVVGPQELPGRSKCSETTCQ